MLDADVDQALGLRRLFEKRGVATVSVAGAAGTTPVTLNLAAALANLGRRVLILDRTHGEASVGLGLKARFDFAHVLSGEKRLDDVVLRGPDRICVLPAARALDAIDAGDADGRRALAKLLDGDDDRFDICLVNGLALARSGADTAFRDVLLVTAPTGASITEAYAQIKVLARHHARHRFRVVVNRARSEATALSIYTSLAETARRFLAAHLDYCGYLPVEPALPAHARRGPREWPAEARSPRAHAFARLAEILAADATAPCAQA
jgi:flagellar biosynthesis protein FlhG